MISKQLTSGPPSAKDNKSLRSFFCSNTTDEAVHGRHVLLFQRVEYRLSNLKTRNCGWPRTMSRQVIERDRKLLCHGMQRCKNKKQAERFLASGLLRKFMSQRRIVTGGYLTDTRAAEINMGRSGSS